MLAATKALGERRGFYQVLGFHSELQDDSHGAITEKQGVKIQKQA
jgi:hypothetical protein